MADLSDEELLEELGVPAETKRAAGRSARDERVIAGFEDIVTFLETHGRPPQHGEHRDIFERLYAVRLDRLRELPDCRMLLTPFDTHGLLTTAEPPAQDAAELDDAALLEDLGVAAPDSDDITSLRHVKSREEIRAAEDVASRTPCTDFSRFAPLFAQARRDLDSGIRQTRPFGKEADIRQGEFFIVGGQMAYIAELGEPVRNEYDRPDRRLRVIYDNKTESDLLLRSLQRALYKDEAGRRITTPDAGPLFNTDAS